MVVKYKHINKLKVDLLDRIFSSYKRTRSSRNLKLDVIGRIREYIRAKSIPYRKYFRVKKSLFLLNKNYKKKHQLDFKSRNRKNAFIRTKRKTAYGLALLEKQKFKNFVFNLKEKYFQRSFKEKPNIAIRKENHKPLRILSTINILSSNLTTKSLFKNKQKVETLHNSFYNIMSIPTNPMYLPFLSYKKKILRRSRKFLHVFKRIVPNHIIVDFRTFKAKCVGASGQFTFNLNTDRVVQFYRTKKG